MPWSSESAPVAVGLMSGERSDASLRFALQEAVLRDAPLIVAIAFRLPVDPDIEDVGVSLAQLERDHAEEAAEAIGRVWNEQDGPLPAYRIRSTAGSLPDVVAGLSPAPALIVVGLHHHHLIDRLLRGRSPVGPTVAHSRVPVVVVPEPG